MALIKCPKCGRTISDVAKTCKCGYLLQHEAEDICMEASSSRRWPTYILAAVILVMVIFVFANQCQHEYTPATCESPAICKKCGREEGERLGHNFEIISCDEPRICSRCGGKNNRTTEHTWRLQSDSIICKVCNKTLLTSDDVKAKAGKNLTSADKALIYQDLDYYLTAMNSNGKYLYSESEAFLIVQSKYNISRSYIDQNIWNGFAYNDYIQYIGISSGSNSGNNSYSGNSSNKYISPDRSRDAWVCAIKYVEDNLKSPSTAKFCKYTDATVMRVGEDEYIIHGYVDAQNSLGATVRQIWTVSLFLTEKGFRNPYLEWG